MQSLSARPSDGIALAVRAGAPIYVRSNVLDEAAVSIQHAPAAPLSDEEIDHIVSDFQKFLESMTAEGFESESWTAHEGQPEEDAGGASDD